MKISLIVNNFFYNFEIKKLVLEEKDLSCDFTFIHFLILKKFRKEISEDLKDLNECCGKLQKIRLIHHHKHSPEMDQRIKCIL